MRTSNLVLLSGIPFTFALSLVAGCSADVRVETSRPGKAVDVVAEVPFDDGISLMCLDESPYLKVPSYNAECAVFTASHVDDSKSCKCDVDAARWPVAAEHQDKLETLRAKPIAAANDWNCFCEIPQLDAAEGHACRYDAEEPLVIFDVLASGFCYINPKLDGNANLLAGCDEALRFVGKGRLTKSESVAGTRLALICDYP